MTTKIADARNFLDINGLNSIRQAAKSDDKESKKVALQEAAQQFEAIFMQMLLKSMRKAEDVLASDSPFNSESTKFYRDMHDQQMSIDLSSNGALGLSDLIVRQLGGDSENYMPSSAFEHRGQLEQFFHADKLLNQTDLLKVEPLKVEPLKAGQLNNKINSLSNKSNETTDITSSTTNKLTPAALINNDSPEDFIKSVAPYANQAAVTLGVRPEVLVAQSALETGWGKKVIKNNQGESSFNMFNIKADARWNGEKVSVNSIEFQGNVATKQRSNFRSYPSIVDSFNDFAQFLKSSSRYDEAIEQGQNSSGFVDKLQQAGYATDPNYAEKIKNILTESPIQKILSAIRTVGE
ncbi:MAG: flagellar assembly peptidoglycan hydrolase FlgJ [Alteromonadaceae bacterium]|nr:flagellar assembly peptidoglycan hydrolase FlgJ [Alteromonadaceae bacterium]